MTFLPLILWAAVLPEVKLDEIPAIMVSTAATAGEKTCYAVIEVGARQTKVYVYDHASGKNKVIDDGRMPMTMVRGILPNETGFYLVDVVRRQVFCVSHEGAFLDSWRLTDFSGVEKNLLLLSLSPMGKDRMLVTGFDGSQYHLYELGFSSRSLKLVGPVAENSKRNKYMKFGSQYLFHNQVTGQISWLDHQFNLKKKVAAARKPETQIQKMPAALAKKIDADAYKIKLQLPLVGQDYVFFTERTADGRRCAALHLKTGKISRGHLKPLGSAGNSHLVFNYKDEEIQHLQADSIAQLMGSGK